MISSHLSPPASSLNKAKRGFALLITITLLAFLVILLIGLATFTRVETAIAGNTQRQAQARETALFALNVALGQLQKYAGPDQRITATADAFPNGTGTTRYTGVWDATTTDATPVAWLVSGNELVAADGTSNAVAITPASTLNTTNGVPLVSTNTSRVTNDVLARLMPITATGVPGAAATASTTIGRYAWWVGDQGMKAPVAVADSSSSVTYTPYDSADLRSRIRQQIALGAGAADSSGNPVFEPRDSNNSSLVANQKISASAQIAFLKNASNAQLGLTRVQQNFHAWSPSNYAVIANTKTGGLKQDLSLNPSLLGSAFAAWADYTSYTENPVNNVTKSGAVTSNTSILPAYDTDPLRRRYTMTPHVLDGNGSHQIGPVLTYFLITFNVRTVDGSSAANAPLEVRARWMLTLWNPYTGALVPEDLQVEVSGLPGSVHIVNDNLLRPTSDVGTFSLTSSATYGSPLVLSLPWASATIPSGVPAEDRHSWLPGRVYTWRSNENTTDASPPSDGYDSTFYSRTLDDSGKGVVRSLGGLIVADGGDQCHLDVAGSANLRVTIYANRASGRVRLGGCTSPDFATNFVTTPQAASANGYQFSYVFRLAESLDTPTAPGTWLTTDGRDLRRRTLPSECYVAAENGNDPSQYGTVNSHSYNKISSPDRLLDRAANAYSYNEDVPIYELPRGPLLSMGAAQHFRLVGRRPFMIGNSWGAGETLNAVPLTELFDRYFFSGLTTAITPSTNTTGDVLLPSPLLKPLRKADGIKVTADDLRNVGATPDSTDADGNTVPGTPSSSQSSKFLLQGGAFNLNSTNATAWAAVLRGVRFPAPQSFAYLDADTATGTAGDGTASVQSSDAQFFRFSQTAQETYKAEEGAAGGDDPSIANTHLFRRGMRTLTAAEVTQLSTSVTDAIKARLAASGPFRSLEEFLAPGDSGAPSLLEQAIADAGINASIAEFSSQWLTQADILTALAPVLFPRSDTFVIRAYGEVLNPATSTPAAPVIEGRAWCEAVVQRLPEYFDPSTATGDAAEVAPAALTSTLNQTYGRRFKIVSFRWLTRSDI